MEFSHMNFGLVLGVDLELTRNSESCLAFFRRCVNFEDMVVASSSVFIAYPAFSRVKASNDLRDRVMALRTEDLEVDASVEAVTQSRGPSLFATPTSDISD
jgi:hypothetical protein